ncbi:unnamed protein product [Heterosigma akashiwo]
MITTISGLRINSFTAQTPSWESRLGLSSRLGYSSRAALSTHSDSSRELNDNMGSDFESGGANDSDREDCDVDNTSSDSNSEVHNVKKGIEIEQCFQKFVEREQLEESDPWYCSRCKEHRQAFKKFDLWSAPDVLILHLKRFLYLPGTYFVHRQKIDELVHFPIEGLDLSPYVLGPTSRDAPPIYDLYAVSEHSGGLGGGHYTAVGKNLRDGKWYSFNDSSVHATEARAAVTARAYVLFYKRRRGSLRWAGATTDAAGT